MVGDSTVHIFLANLWLDNQIQSRFTLFGIRFVVVYVLILIFDREDRGSDRSVTRFDDTITLRK